MRQLSGGAGLTEETLQQCGIGGVIGRQDWFPVGGGESGYIAPYPPDPNIVYAGDYQGNITRFDRRTNQVKSIAVWPELSDARGTCRKITRASRRDP